MVTWCIIFHRQIKGIVATMSLITQAAFSRMHGVSRKTVMVWNRAGHIVLRGGLVDILATNARLSERPATYRGGRTKGPCGDRPTGDAPPSSFSPADANSPFSFAEANRVKENYAAKLKQLDFDRESGIVIEVAAVTRALAGVLTITRTKLLGLGIRLGPRIALLNDAQAIHALLDIEVTRALEELTVAEIQTRFLA